MGRQIYQVIDGHKICTGCHESVPESEYGFIKKKNGRHIQKSKCKSCLKKNTVYWRQNYKERYAESRKKYREENQEKLRVISYRQGAAYRKLPCVLTDEQFITLFNQPCHYCGAHEGLNGVDRADNDQGYVEGNVLPCCVICNFAKKKMSREQFLAWIKQIALHQGF